MTAEGWLLLEILSWFKVHFPNKKSDMPAREACYGVRKGVTTLLSSNRGSIASIDVEYHYVTDYIASDICVKPALSDDDTQG